MAAARGAVAVTKFVFVDWHKRSSNQNRQPALKVNRASLYHGQDWEHGRLVL
jgi:hypothetical protein